MGNGSSNAARNKLNARRAGKVGADLGGKYCDWISAELTRLMVIALSTTTSFANLYSSPLLVLLGDIVVILWGI